MSRGVNIVPMVAPAMMFLIVLYFIPLQMITLINKNRFCQLYKCTVPYLQP